MNFYKLLLLITLIVLFISLAIIGTILYNSSKKSLFPPNVSKCPDYYVMDKGTGTCFHPLDTGDTDSDLPTFTLDDIDNAGNPGTDRLSEACGKKKWAKNNKINWDGLTNNSYICKDNE